MSGSLLNFTTICPSIRLPNKHNYETTNLSGHSIFFFPFLLFNFVFPEEFSNYSLEPREFEFVSETQTSREMKAILTANSPTMSLFIPSRRLGNLQLKRFKECNDESTCHSTFLVIAIKRFLNTRLESLSLNKSVKSARIWIACVYYKRFAIVLHCRAFEKK